MSWEIYVIIALYVLGCVITIALIDGTTEYENLLCELENVDVEYCETSMVDVLIIAMWPLISLVTLIAVILIKVKGKYYG